MKNNVNNKNTAKAVTPKEKLVPVFIPARFKGDDIRTVSVNGRYKHIPTGKTFMIEPSFAEAVANALLADEEAEKFIRASSDSGR